MDGKGRVESVKDIVLESYKENDPETAIKKAILNTECLIRRRIFKMLDPLEMDHKKNPRDFIRIMALNDAVGVALEIAKEVEKIKNTDELVLNSKIPNVDRKIQRDIQRIKEIEEKWFK